MLLLLLRRRSHMKIGLYKHAHCRYPKSCGTYHIHYTLCGAHFWVTVCGCRSESAGTRTQRVEFHSRQLLFFWGTNTHTHPPLAIRDVRLSDLQRQTKHSHAHTRSLDTHTHGTAAAAGRRHDAHGCTPCESHASHSRTMRHEGTLAHHTRTHMNTLAHTHTHFHGKRKTNRNK